MIKMKEKLIFVVYIDEGILNNRERRLSNEG